jgi:long-chain acyl-CoA synthetase
MSFVESAICGASLLPLEIFDAFYKKYGVEIRQGYGLTECFAITCNPRQFNKPQSLGRLMPGAQGLKIKIFDNNADEIPCGQIGEIVVSGPTVMSGYYNEPEVSRGVLRKGWLYTGDLGKFDKDGYLFFAGLKKRITKVAGNMVDLCEVESEIRKVPEVLDVEVYPITDEKLGNMLCAKIVSQKTIEKNRIRNYLKRKLASYKIPMLWN